MNALKRVHDSVTLGDSPHDVERDVEEIVFYQIEKSKGPPIVLIFYSCCVL
jgi:hypothetical protein